MSERHFVFIEGSSRPNGNSAILARRTEQHLPDGASSEWLRLADLPLPDFDADADAAPIFPDGNEGALLAATLRATDLVIVSPLYWYSVSAPVKRYLDHWDGWLHIPGLRFRRTMAGRTLWAISAGYTDDAGKADGLATSLRLTAEYLGMAWGGLLYGNGDQPGDVRQDHTAMRGAEDFLGPAAVPVLRAG
ncbi:MAG: NAD(P)H-dependent oxidoreductase [Renibacterium sp.]|nr:NAD(P)H-dependent oxidoreductase [Renibacterium sp.]